MEEDKDAHDWSRSEAEEEAKEKKGLTETELNHIYSMWETVFRNGDRAALFNVISVCFVCKIPVPGWAANEFIKGWDRYTNAVPDNPDKPGVSTLGGAFGIVRKPGFTPAAVRRRRTLMLEACCRVRARHKEGEPITLELFQSVAVEINKNREAVRTRYRSVYNVKLPDVEARPISGSMVRDFYYKELKPRRLR
jgi:hypothetical protein